MLPLNNREAACFVQHYTDSAGVRLLGRFVSGNRFSDSVGERGEMPLGAVVASANSSG
jgi:hypothetical protein